MIPTRAIVYAAPDRVELVDAAIPEPEGGEFLVETLLTAISPGTELRNLSGKMEGVKYPCVGGYMNVGRVIGRGPAASKAIPDGTLVFCSGTQRTVDLHRTYGGHIGHAVTTSVYPVPSNLTAMDVVLTKIAAVAYKGVRHSAPASHEAVAVVGLGPIGMLSLRCHSVRGCRTIGFDVSPDRVALARAGGNEAYVVEKGLTDARQTHFPRGFDVVVDATGVNAVLRETIALFRDRPWEDALVPGLRLLVQGSYVGDVHVPYSPWFMSEITMIFPRDTQVLDHVSVLDLAARGLLKMADLVSEVASPAEAGRVYAKLAASKSAMMTAAFDWTRL